MLKAQTLANVYLALDNNLEIILVINKVDLPSVRVEETKKEIEDIIGLITDDCPCVSAKTGFNVENVLEKIATEIPSPNGEDQKPLKALIFDSIYND